MTKKIDFEQCKKCGAELSDDFCSKCGNPKTLKRINGSYILSEIVSVLNFDKGIFYTVKVLLVRPGENVQKFILSDRNRLVKPIIFVIICSLIYAIAQHFLSFEAGYIKLDFDSSHKPIIAKMYDWFSNNYGYTNILMAIFIALWIKIFFKNYNYNYYEIYVLLCYIMGISMLIYAFLGIIESIINFPVLQFGVIIGIVYSIWAIGQFFDQKKKLNYLKGFLSYLFGVVSSLIIFILIGILLEKLIK